jgi:thymidine kinase
MKNPEFIMFVGPMASGKTTSLLAMLEKYKYQHKKVFVFKPDVDDRYSQSEIVTHNNFRHAAIPVQSGKKKLKLLFKFFFVLGIVGEVDSGEVVVFFFEEAFEIG